MPPQARRSTKQQQSQGIQLELNGRTYVVRESDLTPRLVAELRRATGFAGWVGLVSETQRGFDLDVLAAFVWLARRIDGELVLFDTVLDEMSYTADMGVTVVDEREAAGPPEA